MRKFRVHNGEIEVSDERLHGNIVRAVWGKCEQVEVLDDEGEEYHDTFVKLGHTVASWFEGAGSGWIKLPEWVAKETEVTLDLG